MTLLLEICSDAKRVAEAIAAALGLEVTIIDDKYNLVASSRRFHEYYIYQKRGLYSSFWMEMFKTKDTLIVEKPGKHAFCQGCNFEGQCPEKALILTPIWYETNIVGSIGITCFTDDQRENVIKKREILSDFLKRMSEFLTIKISEILIHKKLILSLRELETTMDYAKEGLICINREGYITHINFVAKKILNLEGTNPIKHYITQIIPSFPLKDIIEHKIAYEEQELVASSGNKMLNILISAKPILLENEVQSVVISIRDMKEVHALIYKMTGSHKKYSFDDIIGESYEIKNVKHRTKLVANGNSTILIQGETGTGKELFARAIHNYSQRKNGPFIPVNCGAIPESLLESELFGYEEGAFTGAKRGGKPGKFEIASGGTIFLDEIGDMPLHLQVKLLRVLQEKEIERVGGNRIVPVDVRVIAATHKNLEQMVARGEFREDLYYRLNVIPLYIPPLRERTGDILMLSEHFIKKYNALLGKNIKGLSKEATSILVNYSWPGNVRELENCIEYAVNMETQDLIQLKNLPERIMKNRNLNIKQDLYGNFETQKIKKEISAVEEKEIINTLKRYSGVPRAKEKAAQELGISRATLYRKIKELKNRGVTIL